MQGLRLFTPTAKGTESDPGPPPAEGHGVPEPPSGSSFLSAEETARLEREDAEFRAWRQFENRQHSNPSHGKPSRFTADADPKYHEDLQQGATKHEAFRRHNPVCVPPQSRLQRDRRRSYLKCPKDLGCNLRESFTAER